MTVSEDPPVISDLKLELLALGALPPTEESQLRSLLHADPAAQARFAAIAPSDTELLREFPPTEVSAEVARRVRVLQATAAQEGHRPYLVLRWGVLAGVSMAVIVALVAGPAEETGFHIKGEPQIIAHLVNEAEPRQLTAGQAISAGDRVQLSIIGAGSAYAVVASIDGSNHVELHFPRGQGDGRIAVAGSPFSLPHSYELDDAPHFERFFLVASASPIDVAHVLEMVERLTQPHARPRSAALPDLGPDLRQSSLLLNKTRSVP